MITLIIINDVPSLVGIKVNKSSVSDYSSYHSINTTIYWKHNGLVSALCIKLLGMWYISLFIQGDYLFGAPVMFPSYLCLIIYDFHI